MIKKISDYDAFSVQQDFDEQNTVRIYHTRIDPSTSRVIPEELDRFPHDGRLTVRERIELLSYHVEEYFTRITNEAHLR